MPKIVKKTYRVLKKTWIGKALHQPGDVVTIDIDEESFVPGANLQEVKPDAPESPT